jgi:VIT1/CCC1 family predicted Fe2+/Mn2+ transporter
MTARDDFGDAPDLRPETRARMMKRKLEHDHTPEAIRERLARGATQSYLRDWVYGGIDGAVTTFAIVSGVAGARLPTRVIVILGLANVLADGFSMAAANFVGTRSEHEERASLEAIEQKHVDQDPEGEQEEIRQIFRRKGLEGETLEKVVETITRDRRRWVDTMLREEYGLPEAVRSPLRAAGGTLAAFALCGIVPLLPYFLGIVAAFPTAAAATALTFFGIGSLKSRWSPRPWWNSGLETLLIGSAAAAVAYAVGVGLRSP